MGFANVVGDLGFWRPKTSKTRTEQKTPLDIRQQSSPNVSPTRKAGISSEGGGGARRRRADGRSALDYGSGNAARETQESQCQHDFIQSKHLMLFELHKTNEGNDS